MSCRAALCAARGTRRMFSSSAPVRSTNQPINPGYKAIKPTQEAYGVEDQHIHVKGGAVDQLMYKGTMLVCLGGLAFNAWLYTKLSFNK